MSDTSTTGRAALDAANGRARTPAAPPQGDLSHAEAQRRRGWEVRRIGWLMSIKPSISAPHEELLSVFLHKGVIRFIEENEKRTNVTSTDLSKYQLVEPGDFVMNNQQAWRGSVGVSRYRGIVSPAYFVMRLADCLKPDFANYFLRSRRVVSIFERCSRGVGTIQRNLIWDMLKVCRIAFPPLPEQKAIVAYLDAETGKIDKAIAAEERLIELLQERREIVINEGVYSCDWLEAKRLKAILFETRDLSKTGKELPLSLTATDGIIPFSKKKNRTLENDTYVGTKIVRKGQIVFNRFRARLFAVSGYDGLVSPDYAVFSVGAEADARYLVYMFNTLAFKAQLNLLASGIGDGFSRVYAKDLLSVPIQLPPLPEQEAIVKYLDEATEKIDKAIEVKRRQIALLRERREIIIDEVVTGKVKVA